MSNYKQQMENNKADAWTRSTVADGRALNLSTIQKFNNNLITLGDAIDKIVSKDQTSTDLIYNTIQQEVTRAKGVEENLQADIDTLNEKMTDVYKFKGTCKTSDIDGITDKENGDVWNLYGNTILIPADKAYNEQAFSACDGDNIVWITSENAQDGWDILHGIMKFHEIDEYSEITNDASGLVEGKAIYPLKEKIENDSLNYGNLSGFRFINKGEQWNPDNPDQQLYCPTKLTFSADHIEFSYNTNESDPDRFVLKMKSVDIPEFEYHEKYKPGSYDPATDNTYNVDKLTILQLDDGKQENEKEGYFLNYKYDSDSKEKSLRLLPNDPEFGTTDGEYILICKNSGRLGGKAIRAIWESSDTFVNSKLSKIVRVGDTSTKTNIKLATATSMPTTWEDNTFYII